MDLVVSIIALFIIVAYRKVSVDSSSVVTAVVRNDDGTVEDININENKLVVGKNLMLKREPRAYHKILDEMGLS